VVPHWLDGGARWRLLPLLLALGLGVAATGCAGSSAASGQGSAKASSLILGSDPTPRSLDPILADDAEVDESVVPTYDPLVDYDPDGKLTGRLAEKYVVAPDARSITLTLRNATFHDGSPVTGEDVAYTLDRISRLGVGVAHLVTDYASTTVVDQKTVTIKLKTATNLFLGSLSRVYILNSKLVKANAGGDDGQAYLATHEAGSGPYVLKDYQPSTPTRFQRYDKYWDPAAADEIQTVTYRPLAETVTHRDELLAGGIQGSLSIDPGDLAQFTGNPKYHVTELKKAQGTYVFFNTQRGLLRDPRVREAIRLSYDYQGHVSTILGGAGSVATGPLPNTMSCRPDLPPPTMDLDKARSLLAQAGASGATFTMEYQPIFSEHKDAATALQGQLKKIGVTLNLKAITYQQYLQQLKSPDSTPDLAMLWDNPPTPDPGSMLYTRYDSKFVGSSTNFGQYHNPQLDSLLDKAVTTPDANESCQLYEQAQRLLVADSAVMYIADHKQVVVSSVPFKDMRLYPAHVNWVPQTLRLG
jgi:peptide/nickel transport system substrate-binding protein